MGVNGKRDEKHNFSRKNKKNREENKGKKQRKNSENYKKYRNESFFIAIKSEVIST